MNPLAAILVITTLYYVIILWLQRDHDNIQKHQRDRILELIEENQSLKARLRLHGIECKDN